MPQMKHKESIINVGKIIKVNIEPFVLKYLAIGASPEQISGRLKLEYQKDKDRTVCTKTIYRYIYDHVNGYHLC